jgi:hypothetical protein
MTSREALWSARRFLQLCAQWPAYPCRLPTNDQWNHMLPNTSLIML